MMKKRLCMALIAVLAMSFGLLAFAGCGGTKFNVEFLDGEEVIRTVQVEEGKQVEGYIPLKDGYDFVGWYAAPSLTHKFDFSQKITKDTQVFVSWKNKNFVEDTRAWVIAGTGKSEFMTENNWGKAADLSKYKLTSDGENNFSITLDLYEEDMFQIATVDDADVWTDQRGFGYLANPGDNFSSGAGIGETALPKTNIQVLKDGKYKITLSTEIDNPSLDKIKCERVGDAASLEVVYTPVISGTINNFGLIPTPISGSPFAFGKIEEKDENNNPVENVFELVISLNQGDEFSIQPFNSWSTSLKMKALDQDNSDMASLAAAKLNSKNEVMDLNIKVTEAGEYTIKCYPAEGTGRLVIKKTGDFSRADNEIRFVYAESSGTDFTAYVRQGARVPRPADATEVAGKVFVGWFDGNDKIFNFEKPLTGYGATITLTAKFRGEAEADIRGYGIYGSDIEIKDFANWNTVAQMTSDGKHTYTMTVKVKENAQLVLKETVQDGGKDVLTGITIGATKVGGVQFDQDGNIVDHDFLKGNGNIIFTKAGSYTITYDANTGIITIAQA